MQRRSLRTFLAACFLTACSGGGIDGNGPQQTVQHNPTILTALQYDVSPPFDKIHPADKLDDDAEMEMPIPGRIPFQEGLLPVGREDPLRQAFTEALIPSANLNIDGNGDGFTGPNGTFQVAVAPPDTNGDVGPNHYVQIVNLDLTVFNKSGTPIMGPVATNTLFAGFGGGCETTNDGDPLVQYDQLADRWVVSQFVVTQGAPFLQCVAVSTSPDPTGSYNRYSFQFANFNDYPKMGVWPDAYYFTFNDFNASGTAFVGGETCAFDRTRMLQGQMATAQCFNAGSQFGGLLPSDLDGPTSPPAGSPNFVVGLGGNSLNFWKFHVDFATPANTTFSGPTTIPVASFTSACGGARTCIPQPSTSQQLDGLSDRLMYRFAYRNYGDHESLVVNHSVQASPAVSGIRWYELRNPNAATPTVFQQGTFSPDGNSRWMGSVAMDHVGNLAAGFSISSTSVRPGVRYAGRLAADPPGELSQGEATLVDGTGSQTAGLSRWGDYSALVVDPSDDCTFWYTTEYMANDGTFNWRTRIGNFKFANCNGGGGDTTPPTTNITDPADGSTVSGTITISASAMDNVGVTRVDFLVDGNVVGSDSTSPFSTSFDTTTVANGAHQLTSKAFDAAGNVGTSGTVNVNVANNAANDFSVSINPSNRTVNQGASTTYTVSTAVTSGNAQTVDLSVSGLPAGVTGSLSPTSVTAGGSSTLTLNVAASAAVGTTSFTVTGAGSGGPSHTASASVTVNGAGGGALVNGDFETGTLAGWTVVTGDVSISSTSHGGSFAAQIGSQSPFNGDSTLTQTIAVPASGSTSLTFFFNPHCPDTITFDQQTAEIRSTSGQTLVQIFNVCSNTQIYQQAQADLTPFAGQSVVLYFNDHDDNFATDPTFFLVDDVQVTTTGGTDLIRNGGFETGISPWKKGGAKLPIRSVFHPHTGLISLRCGATTAPGNPEPNGDSFAFQTVSIPANVTRATLNFFYFAQTTDPADTQQALIRNRDGTQVLQTIFSMNDNSRTWTPQTVDVTALKGQTIQVFYNVHSNGLTTPTTLWIDDVSLIVQ